MATIKSYTSLEQSKKLAEILPLESADMYYPNRTDIKYQGALPIGFKHGNPLLSQEIAAWSLASLLDVLPNENMLVKTTNSDYYCLAKYVMTKYYDNPIDACYEMILKLNELNLL